LRRRGRPKTVEDLATHDWILFRARTTRATVSLTGPDGERTIEINGPLLTDDLAFGRAACEAGAGIARLGLTRAGQLERVLPRWSAGTVPIWLVMPAAKLVPRRVSLVREFLLAHLPKRINAGSRSGDAAR